MTQFFLSHLPWFWLLVCAACLLFEAATVALTTIWFACGALVMVFLSFIDFPFRWQVLVFVLISLALLLFTRPFAIKKLAAKKTATNTDRLIGRKCVVTQRMTDIEKGAVKIDGVEWTAQSDGGTIEEGELVEILGISGATLIAKKNS